MGFLDLFLKKTALLPGWRPLGRRQVAHVDGYSVEIQNGIREGVSVIYRQGVYVLVLDGERVGRRWRQINIRVPKTETAGRIDVIVPRVAEGLESLGAEFILYKLGEPLILPEQERLDAATYSRNMGITAEVSPDGRVIKLKRLAGNNSKAGANKDTENQALRMLRNVQAQSRVPTIVLAKSPDAIE